MRQKLAAILLAGTLYAATASAAEVFVRVGPPPPVRMGIVGVAPSPNHVWVNGYQEWVGRRYVWHDGYWAPRPYPRAIWVEHRWVPRRGGYVFVPGHWARR
jgi:hypothetical protein